jgi:hypothetical protein
MTLTEWREHDKNWRKSGMNQIDYCKRNKISHHVFKERGTKARKLEAKNEFVKLDFTKREKNRSIFEIGISSDWKIFINFNLEILI